MNHKQLKQELPFIIEMIESVKTVEFRQKWQNMKDLIESNKLTNKQIETIELNIKKAKQLKEQYKKSHVTVIPVTKNDEKSLNVSAEMSQEKDAKAIKAEIKRQKELKRLHENIVKDGSPLPSKRRSALKRSYRDSLELLLEKSPSRSQEKKIKPESSEKLINPNKRKSETAFPTFTPKDNQKVFSKKIKSPEIINPAQKSFLFSETPKTKLEAKELTEKASKETKISQLTNKPPQKVEEPNKTVEIKKASIDKLKRKIQKHKKEIFKKKTRANLLTKGAANKAQDKVDDDEWEDMDEALESEEEPKAVASKTLIKKEVKIIPKSEEKPKVEAKVETKNKPVPKVDAKLPLCPAPKLNPVTIKKVQNMSYIACKTGFIFKCLVSACKFFTMDNSAFVDHIENEHLTVKWEGQCDICNEKVDKTRSIIFELMHMRENHVLKEQVDSEKSPEAVEHSDSLSASKTEKIPEIQPNIEDEGKKPAKEQSKSEVKTLGTVKIVGKKIDIGKITLKPIASLLSPPQVQNIQPQPESKTKESTSDYSRSSSSQSEASNSLQPCSSGSIKEKLASGNKIVKHVIPKPPPREPSPKPKEVIVRTYVPPSQLKPSGSEEKLGIQRQKSVDIQKDMSTADLLRPWLKRKVKKYLMPTTRFLDNLAAIVSTYKCMSSKCSFFTSDQKLFSIHLKLHETHQPGDRDFMNCAYCDYIFADTDGPIVLVDHFDKDHCFDKFQCRYCFYRSCVSLNVINHQKIFHPMKPKSIYELPNEKTRDYDQELAAIKKSRTKFVPPLVCVKCSAKFYLFPKLAAHMQTHGPNIKTKCTKCSEVSDLSNIHTHFINCHNLGLYQCVFCNFGTNSFDSVVNHIGSCHPSNPPIYCERSSETPDEVNPSLIDSTSMKFLTQQVDHRIIEIPKVDKDVVRNEFNVRDLGGNIKVRPKPTSSQKPKSPSAHTSTPTQVKNPMSVQKKQTDADKNTLSAPNNKAKTSQPSPNTEKASAVQVAKHAAKGTNVDKSKSPQVAKNVATKSPARGTNNNEKSKPPQVEKVLKKSPAFAFKRIQMIEGIRKRAQDAIGTKQSPISNEKNSGLQIKSVYSLNDSK